MPHTIAELGPGDSLGLGLAALLSGCNKYFALDVIKYWNIERNLQIFDELTSMFRNRSPIPDNTEYPGIGPEIGNYEFPSEIISEDVLNASLSEDRLELIRNEISNIDNSGSKFISYQIPWYDSSVIEGSSVDFIISQAVLEHVEDLGNTYKAMSLWLKPKGYSSHKIDFRSHEITKSWNGHWTFNKLEWSIVKGCKVYLLNRQPYSVHIELLEKNGFRTIEKILTKSVSKLTPVQLAREFKNLNESELTTSGMYILSIKD